MNLKRSPFSIQDKNARDLDNVRDYPTIADLMREQKVPQHARDTVHHRSNIFLIASIESLYFSGSPKSILINIY